MTDPRDDSTRHLDPDVLADLQEGLLDRPAATTAQAHLAGCAVCRGDLAALEELRHRLAATPDVGPLPADLVDRLAAALADAATEPRSSIASPAVVPLRTPEPSAPRGMRLLQIAAVFVLLLAGGAVGVSALNGSGGGSNGDSAATDSGGQASAEAGADAATFPVTASGSDWSAATLRAAAPELVNASLAPAAVGRLAAPSAADKDSAAAGDDRYRQLAEAPAARLAGGQPLATCAADLAGAPVTPVAVDLARYEGQPAAVLLLPTPDDPASVDVYVVKPACPPGEFLYFARVPRS
jgi:hypothetical protein